MAILDPEKFAILRTMLNDPNRDAASIINLLKQWPEDEGKIQARQYAEDYFKHNDSIDLQPFSSRQSNKMLFDPHEQNLFTNNGQHIKKMDCLYEKNGKICNPLMMKISSDTVCRAKKLSSIQRA